MLNSTSGQPQPEVLSIGEAVWVVCDSCILTSFGVIDTPPARDQSRCASPTRFQGGQVYTSLLVLQVFVSMILFVILVTFLSSSETGASNVNPGTQVPGLHDDLYGLWLMMATKMHGCNANPFA